MTNRIVSAGVNSYVLYGKESTFNIAGTTNKRFGIDTNFSANLTNTISGRRGMAGSTTSGRDIQKYVYGKAEYSLTIDFDVNDCSFLEFVLGNVDTTGKIYTGYATTGGVSNDVPSSITIANCIDNTTTDRDEIYTGCVVKSATIKCAMDEPVTASLSLMAATMAYDSSLTTNVALTDKAPFSFIGSTYELPNSTTITNLVESFEFTINNNPTYQYGANRTAQYVTFGAREYELKLSTKYIADDILNKALGGTSLSGVNHPTENATLTATFSRPEGDKIKLEFKLVPISAYTLNASLNEPIGEDIDLIAKEVTITYTPSP